MDVQEGIDRLAQCLGAVKSRVLSVPARKTTDQQSRKSWEDDLNAALDAAVTSFTDFDDDDGEAPEASASPPSPVG